MVKSMLDLRQLDSFRHDGPEELGSEVRTNQTPEIKTCPLDFSPSPCGPRRTGPGMEAGLQRTNRELGSTISLQVAWDDKARTNQRPDFILLSNHSPDGENPVLYPDQWEDGVSLAGSEFQVKEACPAGGRQDKPSPDSGCSLALSSRLSSPDGHEEAELLSVDGNLSEPEEEEEGGAGGGVSQQVPQTPDQEAFVKEHFITLSDLAGSVSPTRASLSSSENLSISSRFLSQTGSRAVVPLPSRTGGEVKVRPLVSEVRPLNQNRTKDWEVSLNQDQTSSPQNQTSSPQDQTSSPQGQTSSPQGRIQSRNESDQDHIHPPQVQSQEEETPLAEQAQCPAPLKKESKRNLGPTARAAASHLNLNPGLRKARSVHSLLSDPIGPEGLDMEEPPPQLLLPLQRPTTLPSSPRRPPSSTSLPHQRPGPASPRSPKQETAFALCAATGPRKSSSSSSSSSALLASRSYMSPTTSSMAKMSRSISVGDGLNIAEPGEDGVVTSSLCSSEVKDTPPPLVAVVPSNVALATPPHAAVVPVVASPSSSSALGNHGNHTAPPPRSLQARVPGSSRPLPDKPSLASFSPSAKAAASSSATSRTPPVSVSPLTPPRQEGEEPQTPAGVSSEQRDNADHPISMESCSALTNELRSCFHRATHLYRRVSGSSTDSAPDRRQMAVLLSEAFQAMRAELDSLPLSSPSMLGEQGGLGGVGGVKTAALLEEYSLLLLQAVHRRMDSSS